MPRKRSRCGKRTLDDICPYVAADNNELYIFKPLQIGDVGFSQRKDFVRSYVRMRICQINIGV
jgi:hypothetical protein